MYFFLDHTSVVTHGNDVTKDLETISKSANQRKMSFDPNQAKQSQQKKTIFPHFSIMLYSIIIPTRYTTRFEFEF